MGWEQGAKIAEKHRPTSNALAILLSDPGHTLGQRSWAYINSTFRPLDTDALSGRLVAGAAIMVGRFSSKSEVVFGLPHTFGWVRCPDLDANGLQGWERPDGTTARLRRGAQLVRLRGAQGRPIVVQWGTRAG